MIAADRLALQANVVQAISSNLRMLVDLYAGNLNSISVQATVLAALGYASVASTNFNNERLNSENKIISGLYFATAITCLICAMLCVILCTIAAVYGPQLALTGDSNATIIKAVVEMKRTQSRVFYLLAIALYAFMSSIVVYSHGNYKRGQAIMVSIIILFALGIITVHSIRSMKSVRYRGQKYLDELFKLMHGEEDQSKDAADSSSSARKPAAPAYPTVTVSAPIWVREPLHDGGNFYLMYGVVHRGVLELFKSQDGYDTGARAVKKVQLRNLHLSLRPQEFHQSATGFISLPSFSGFKLDLKLLFAVVPREDHEVVASVDMIELQATDAQSKSEWVTALQTVDAFFDKVRGNAATAIIKG